MKLVLQFAKWLLALAAIGLFAVAGRAYLDAGRVRDVMANGTETTALVAGGRQGVRQIGGDAYAVHLTWQDATGTEHTAKGLAVVGVLGRQLQSGEAGDPPTLLVKYDPAAPGRTPVIVRQAALDQESNARNLAWGAIGGAICLFGAGLFAWLSRRRGP